MMSAIRAFGLIAVPLVALSASVASVANDPARPDDEQRQVKVPANTMPWDTRINRNFNFGKHNGRPPVMVFDPMIRPGITVKLAVSGTSTTYGDDKTAIPAVGEIITPTRNQPEEGWPRFPSRYFAKDSKPSYLNGVVGVFTNADGEIVGVPFAVGTEVTVVVPDGAVALSLGVDDDNFSDNTGSLTVVVTLPRPKVTVE